MPFEAALGLGHQTASSTTTRLRQRGLLERDSLSMTRRNNIAWRLRVKEEAKC